MHPKYLYQTFIGSVKQCKHCNIPPCWWWKRAGASDLPHKLLNQQEWPTSLTPLCIIWWGPVHYSHPLLIVLHYGPQSAACKTIFPETSVCEDRVLQWCQWIIWEPCRDLTITEEADISPISQCSERRHLNKYEVGSLMDFTAAWEQFTGRPNLWFPVLRRVEPFSSSSVLCHDPHPHHIWTRITTVI